MYTVNRTTVELQAGPDSPAMSIIANGNGTYDVVSDQPPRGTGYDAAGAAAAIAGDDPESMIAALNDAGKRIENLIAELDKLAAAEEFDTENPR